jgi:two-component system chemotaxis response regulator CheY
VFSAAVPGPPGRQSGAVAPVNTSVAHILLVEDDRDIQMAMQEVLEEEGFLVTVANNGREALGHLSALQPLPDAILLDLMMPVMDGYEFRRHMQQVPAYKAIPVVVVSADRNAREKTRQMDVAAFLEKPLNLNDLLDTIAGIRLHP